MTALQLIIGLFTLVTNAFFVGGEFALISVRRSQVEPRAEAGDRRARTVIWGLEHVSAMLATAQLGITVSSLLLGAVAEPAIAHLLEPAFHAVGMPDALTHVVAFVIALTAATYLHMLIGEMIPKNIALAAPDRAAYLLVPPLVATTRALHPLVFSINAFANTLLRLLKVEPKDEVSSVSTEDELARMVKDSSDADLLSARDTELLQDALELGRRPVSEVVTPDSEVVFAHPGTTPAQLERLAASTGFSRFPVLGHDRKVAGYLHIKDALDADGDRDRPFPVRVLRPIARVPADTPLDDVLTAMRRSGTHLAAAVAADGTPLGLVTMEDVLKELVGPAPSASAS
ncbi:hemolysin family protein [Kitasatospora indigofera]|uniref:hemolysin family protein n=1 Tax=Kitasatospora indigofera TaxID=67307 RepID=UPI003633D7EF